MNRLSLKLCSGAVAEQRDITIHKAIIAGWTGRDQLAVQEHIAELEKLGVTPPETVPAYYAVAASNLTTDTQIEAVGGDSSGEVEFVILKDEEQLWVGVGSDHTDRKLEAYDVTFSKQVCAKPIADTFWLFSDVEPHWDQLELTSHIHENGEPVTYQLGRTSSMLPPGELVRRYEEMTGRTFEDGMVMFGGTLAALGDIRPSANFEFEIRDPVLGRKIVHRYDISEI